MLGPETLRATGLFKPGPVGQLARRAQQGDRLGETDEMALVGIISTQLLHRQFVEHFSRDAMLSHKARVKVCRQTANHKPT